MTNRDSWHDLKQLLRSQRLGVLATDKQGTPYTSLVAIAVTEDYRGIVFATPRETHKYRNLTHNPEASLLIDNRSNETDDFHQAMAVTVLGSAHELEKSKNEVYQHLFTEAHPYLCDFVSSPSSSLLLFQVRCYYLVRHFQHVVELTP